jgi:maltose alpha-D-glucosyltransferase/alpha-amylase
MWEQYAPVPRMRINLGIRRRLAPLLDDDQRKIELANSLLFTLPGSPIIYYGDEIGMGDNLDLPDRNGVRTPMQWDGSRNAGFTTGTPFAPLLQDYPRVNVASQLQDKGSLFHSISRMIEIRKKHPAFGHGAMEWVDVDNPALAVYTRSLQGEIFLVINNLSASPQKISLPAELHGNYLDLLADSRMRIHASVDLPPHEHQWLKRI